ncbi:MAG: signal peptidase I [Dehalococcoidia bacterium]|nr:signal peptidase I [Dehalococcoidia bacterium]
MHHINFHKQVVLPDERYTKNIDSKNLGLRHFPDSTLEVPDNSKYIYRKIMLNQKIADVIYEYTLVSEAQPIALDAESSSLQNIQSAIKEISKIFIIAFIVFIFSRQAFQNYVVSGISMEPTFYNNDYLIVNKLTYKSINTTWIPFLDRESLEIRNTLKIGDIIVFAQGGEYKRNLVKRIAAMPGQIVQMQDGIITVDGTPIQEFDAQAPSLLRMPKLYLEKIIVPEGKVFVLGDNKYASNDSRYLGFIEMHDIIGKTQLIYWPRDRINNLEHGIKYNLGK